MGSALALAMAEAASAHQAATATREETGQQRAGRARRTNGDPKRAQQGTTAAAVPAALDSLSRLQQLADASPRVAQLRRLQALADGRLAPVPQLAGGPEEEEELVQGNFASAELQPQHQQAPRANNTGLPDQLKSGIESLSGLSMDHVRVHYNSSQPAQLNALAYAQGSDIHLAPGQERHLPHEAWHVVQQAQGRVRPTLQTKDGVPVNDDVGLEREADVIGEKANHMTGLEGVSNAGLSPVPPQVFQRKLYPYRDETKSEDMTRVAESLSEDVDTSKAIVDANPLLQGVDGRDTGHLRTWVSIFERFLDIGGVPDFFYARYGYAVETLATGFFKTRNIAPYEAHDQMTCGATRPDFVIKRDGSDVAWLDITSEGSPEHIFDKQGSGWVSKPYVAEIRYQMPWPDDFKETASGKLTEDQLEKLKAASSARAEQDRQLANGCDKMATYLSNALAKAREIKGDSLSRKDAKQVIKEICNFHLGRYVYELTVRIAAGVTSSIETMEVNGEISTGISWAKWAFDEGGDTKAGRALLAKLGAKE